MELPVLDSRKVLLDNLLAKITPLCSTKLLAEQILPEIANNLQNKDIIHLLQDDHALFDIVNKSNAYANEKEKLGEQLFDKVFVIEPDLCSKITGMLLELDTITIKRLLVNQEIFLKAVDKSKKEYAYFMHQQEIKEELGETLFQIVSEQYPQEVASHLTGMLLELEFDIVEKLIKNRAELDKKLNLAYQAYKSYRLTNQC